MKFIIKTDSKIHNRRLEIVYSFQYYFFTSKNNSSFSGFNHLKGLPLKFLKNVGKSIKYIKLKGKLSEKTMNCEVTNILQDT